MLPGLVAVCGLAILLIGTIKPIDGVAIGLATATLALVGVRMAPAPVVDGSQQLARSA